MTTASGGDFQDAPASVRSEGVLVGPVLAQVNWRRFPDGDRNRLPGVPLAQNFRPNAGTPYHVQTGDGWKSLAASTYIDVWNLIEYDFQTFEIPTR